MWEELSVNHFLKHSNHFKRTLKMLYNGTVHFGYSATFNLLTAALLLWQKKAKWTFKRSTVSFDYV